MHDAGYNPSPYVSFETRVLDRVKVRAAQMISPEFALRPEARFAVDHCANALLVELRASVLEDRRHHHEETVRFAEQPVYRDWKQHLVASLPPDSLRRRFLERLWEVDEPNGTRIVHEVTQTRRALFPGNRMEYPEHLGAVQYVVSNDHRSWPEDRSFHRNDERPPR
jgi:hypothetical protein